MQNKNVQMSLFDTYKDVCSKMENAKSEFIQMLEAYINLKDIIPLKFYWAFTVISAENGIHSRKLHKILYPSGCYWNFTR